MRQVTFDGHLLNDVVAVEDVRRPLWAGQRVEAVEVPGADGCLVRAASFAAPTVEVDVRCIRRTKADMREALSTVASWLAARGPRRFEQSDRAGLWDWAVPTGTPSVDEFLGTGGATVSFLLTECASHGLAMRADAAAGKPAQAMVGGTYRTAPLLTCSAAVRDASTGLWGVRLDGGDFVRVALADGSPHRVEVDCSARTCKVDGANAVPTLDSDWLALEPGAHELAVELGDGGCSVTWDERWL